MITESCDSAPRMSENMLQQLSAGTDTVANRATYRSINRTSILEARIYRRQPMLCLKGKTRDKTYESVACQRGERLSENARISVSLMLRTGRRTVTKVKPYNLDLGIVLPRMPSFDGFYACASDRMRKRMFRAGPSSSRALVLCRLRAYAWTLRHAETTIGIDAKI